MLWQDAYCMAIGDDTLHPVFPLCPKAWPHQDLLTEKVLLDPVPELAPEAVDIRKRGQVCGTHDIDAGERMSRSAAKHETLQEERTYLKLSIRFRLLRQDAGVVLA